MSERWRLAAARLPRYLRHAYVDLRIFLAGRSQPGIPPLRLAFVGPGDYVATGRHLAELLLRWGGLGPDDRVLDIGCGVGRVAAALTATIRPPGRYEGFDIVPSWVRWCRRHLGRAHPHFHFTLAPVRNPEYRARGIPAEEYRFPYADESFDLAFATSVFTHLQPAEAARYLTEAARVLAPGGRLVASFFLLRPDRDLAAAVPGYQFPVDRGDHRLNDAANPAAAIAFDEAWLRRELTAAGLAVEEPIRWGAWSDPGGESFQDFVVARRPSG